MLGKMGGVSPMFNDLIPAQDAQEAARWSFFDRKGIALPREQWASTRAFRGERDYAGLLGSFRNGEEHKVRVTCVPVSDPGNEVAIVAFLQLLDTRTRAAEGSHMDLQQRLIDQLVQAVSSSGQNIAANGTSKLAS